VVRVNIHPRPVTTDCDYYLPYHGNSYNQTRHGTDSYLSSFLSIITPDHEVELVCDEYHVSRLVTVKKILSTHYTKIKLTHLPTIDLPAESLFKKNYAVVDRPTGLDSTKLIEYYLSVQPRLTEFSERYTFLTHSRDHGYFTNVKRYWYQYGQQMPAAPTAEHQVLYELFQELFDPMVDVFAQFLSATALTQTDIERGLMFRLNHNPVDSGLGDQLVNRHGDNSIVTAWIGQNHTGALLDQGQEHELGLTPIESLHNANDQILLFPGFDYSNVASTATPASWHTVKNSDNVNRVALVAFLKYL
jgi:hypothetical protein